MAGARRRPIDRHAMAHAASHHLLAPDIVLTPAASMTFRVSSGWSDVKAVRSTELLDSCRSFAVLSEKHGYEGCVIFGHAKDGNFHLMRNERFDDPPSLARYRGFTEGLVDLVLGHGGSL